MGAESGDEAVFEMPDPAAATTEDIMLVAKAIGPNAMFGGLLSAALAGVYAERKRRTALTDEQIISSPGSSGE